MVKKAFLSLLFLILPISLYAVDASIGVNNFSGLDTADPPSAIQPGKSQDLLNVRLQPGGKSVHKRDGYGLFQTLNSISTATVHGGYHFQQTGGADVQLWGSDTGLYASVNDATFVKVATGTAGSTWQCTDNLGFAYCVTSSGVDIPVKTDGTIANTTYVVTIPSGTIIASTPLQLVIAGVQGNLSSVYVSSNNGFAFFGSGPLPTDPYTEIINAPGSRITHLGYYFGNIYWWKDQSFGYISGSASQGTVGIVIVSNQIGTLDDSSAFWNPASYDTGNQFSSGAGPTSSGNPYFNEMQQLGGIFFRGQDNHIYQYDGYNLTRLSRIITPNITSSSRHKFDSWNQSTTTDWNSGTFSANNNISTVTILNSMQWKAAGADFTTSDFSSGTLTGLSMNAPGLQISTDVANVLNNSFESSLTNWTSPSGIAVNKNGGGTHCFNTGPKDGSFLFEDNVNSGVDPATVHFKVLHCGDNAVLGDLSISVTYGGSCAWQQATIPISTTRQCAFLTVQNTSDGVTYLTSNDFLTNGNSMTFWYIPDHFGGGGFSGTDLSIDFFQNGRTDNEANSQISRTFDTGKQSSILIPHVAWTIIGSTPSFVLQSSPDGTIFSDVTTSTGISTTINNRYVRYLSTWTFSPNLDYGSSWQSVDLQPLTFISTWTSVAHNIPNITTFGNLTVGQDISNGGTISYTVCSANNSGMSSEVCSVVPINSQISIATNTYVQVIATFTAISSTQTMAVNNIMVNWFEGSASDKAYIEYFQDAIWFSVSSGSNTSTNNTIFYLDLLNSTWLKDNIPSNGFAVENNALYIGDPLSANVYKFGGVTTDKGGSIQSYWKSMDFTGQDPTVQNDYDQADFAFGESSNTVSFVYQVDQNPSLTVTKSIPLYSVSSSIVKRGFALDKKAIGTYFNFSVGDNSSLSPWTLMGERTSYNPFTWRPQESN